MAEGDTHRPHGQIHEGVVEEHIAAEEQDQSRRGADYVEGDVDDRHPPGVAVDADGADEGGDAGADVLAHDDGNGHAVGDGAREGQGLQDAHRRGGGLNDAGEHRAYQHAQQGIPEGRQDLGELRHIRQGADGVFHQLHAVHQNGEAHQDAADVPPPLLLGAHDQDHARQGQQRGEILRLEHIDENAPALNARQGENPRRQRGADVGAHDHTDGLADLHDAGVHQAHQHHRHGRGGLDGDGDARPQKKALEGIGGHALEQSLQLAAGHLLQAL